MFCGETNQVIVKNKEIIECTRCCTGLSLSIQGFIVQVDFYAFSLATYQAILGVQWLKTLCLIQMDYKELRMTFAQSSWTHILRGMKSSKLTPISENNCCTYQVWGFLFMRL